jgi:hypothetical protein
LHGTAKALTTMGICVTHVGILMMC